MNTHNTVLLMGALAKVMELSRTHCSMLAKQTVITLSALSKNSSLPPSLHQQIEEMLDSLIEEHQLHRNYQEGPESDTPSVDAFCIKPTRIHKAPLYADTTLV